MAKVSKVSDVSFSYTTAGDQDIYRLIDSVKKGLPYTLFQAILRKSPFSIADWSGFLHLSERTMQRYKKEKKAFDPIYAEKILEVTQLYQYGTTVFGNKESFDNWLETKNLALGGTRPRDLLDTTFGIGLLKDELTRIEHGILA